MDAVDLIILGRQLTRLGEQALRDAPPAEEGAAVPGPALAAGALIVLRDVLDHPGSSISDIVTRTGLPQSYTSECVSKLRDQGLAEVSSDPADRRRTRVRLRPGNAELAARQSARPVDDLLRTALDDGDTGADQAIAALSAVAARLRADRPGLPAA